MEFKVKVTGDIAGNIVIQSNNPEWGHIRVEQPRIEIDEKGFARKKVMTALIPGTVNDLKSFNWEAQQEIAGTVYFKEQLTPFNLKEPERDYKIAGKTGIVCCIEGQPIYRKTFYSKKSDANDIHILDAQGNPMTHDNSEAIRLAYALIKERKGTKNELDLSNM